MQQLHCVMKMQNIYSTLYARFAGGGPDRLVIFVALRAGTKATERQLLQACQVGKAIRAITTSLIFAPPQIEGLAGRICGAAAGRRRQQTAGAGGVPSSDYTLDAFMQLTLAVCFVVPRTATSWIRRILKALSSQAAIRAQLNPLFKVSRVVIKDALPRTASNKLMRRVLRDEELPQEKRPVAKL